MKSGIFPLLISVLLGAPVLVRAQNIFDQQSLPVEPTRYSLEDSFDAIKTGVDRDSKNETSPSKHVLYDDSNDSTPASPSSSKVNAPSVANASGLAGFFASYYPTAGGRAGVSKYLSIVQPQTYTSDQSVGTANTGIALWFDRELAGNSCVQRRAVDFYTAVGKITEVVNAPTAGLSRNVQSESQGRLSPGWLWKLATKAAGGDSGLALMLISMCGHDDHAQGGLNDSSFTFRDDSQQARAIIDNKIARYSDIRRDLQEQLRTPSVQTKSRFANLDREVTNLRRAHPMTTISCPVRPSIFFSSESLGKAVDIPDSLKNEIQTVQNPDRLFDLPAKYYHVYTGAFLACQMIESGMGARNAKAVAAEGAKVYRGIRLCQTLTDATIGWSPDGYRTPEDFLLSKDLSKKCADKKFSATNSGLCAFAGQATFYRRTIRDLNELRRKIAGIVATADASVLYRRWFFGGVTQAIGKKFACTDAQLIGPKNLLEAETDGAIDNTGFELGAIYKPIAWSNARYESAKRKLATWMVDSKWTVAQHKAGADFAAKNCKPRPANETIEQAACRIDANGANAASKAARSVK